jgi:heat shock protein HslJ
MKKKSLLVILIGLTALGLILILAACADQGPSDSESTSLPPEPGTGVGEEAVGGPTPTESPDSPAPADAGPPLTANQITGILWQWQDLVETDPAGQSVVPNPENYSVVFLDDGQMQILADCNMVSASYLIDSGQIRIILGPSTMAFCGDESLDVQFLNHLSKTTSGTVDEDGSLKLYTSEGATLGLNNAGEPLPPQTGAGVEAIANILWQWQDLMETQPSGQSVVPNPENYTIGFRYDGTVNVKADCNNFLGTYELQGNNLTVALGPTTMVFCGEESLDQQFLALLGTVNTFAIEGGRLELSSSGAAMGFNNGGKLPGTVGISPDDISLDTIGVAESWQAYVVEETPYDASMPPGPVGLPEHIEITFNGQTPEEVDYFDPVMFIIPVKAYESMYELNDNESITRIMNQIASFTYELPDPPPTSGMPVLPVEKVGMGYNDLAVQVGRVGADSESASKNGFRFIGRWNQDANPVTNQGLRYVYQGFTNDGVYLVSYWNPVRTDALPDDPSGLTQEVMDAFNNDPLSHISTQAENLNGLSPTDWQPDINNLDALVASLQIEDMVSSGVMDITWAWTGRGPEDGESDPVNNPTQYTITYNSDGTFNYLADCNVGGGGFSVLGGFSGSIRQALGPSTLAACPPDSRADEFLGALAAAEEFRLLPGGRQMQLLLPTNEALTFIDASYIEIDIPEPQPGVPTATVTAPDGIFVRTGPGTFYPSLGLAPYGETGTVIGVSEDGEWWVVDAPNAPAGQAWVSAAFVEVVNGENVPIMPTPVLPTPVPTPSPVPPPSPSISFRADSTVINKGDCTTLRWNVENIQAVWVYPAGSNYQEYPQTGQGSQQVCPEKTTTYEMRVLHTDGSTEIRSITIQVNESNPLADTSWSVASLNLNQVPLADSSMTLNFIGASEAAANGGCNTYGGPYGVYINGISIGPLAGTRLSCGEDLDTQEAAYVQALETATTFTLLGDQLVLYAPGNVEVARFARLQAVPLTG